MCNARCRRSSGRRPRRVSSAVWLRTANAAAVARRDLRGQEERIRAHFSITKVAYTVLAAVGIAGWIIVFGLLFLSVAYEDAAHGATPQSEVQRLRPLTCSQVSASRYNSWLRVRRGITGNDQHFRSKPVCADRYRSLVRSVKRQRQKCKAGATYAVASVYGPGFYGRTTANGTTLTPSTVGVAHKTLPFGTKLHFHYGSRTVPAPVIDRGPFVAGRTWDLTTRLQQLLGFPYGVGTVATTSRPCRGVF